MDSGCIVGLTCAEKKSHVTATGAYGDTARTQSSQAATPKSKAMGTQDAAPRSLHSTFIRGQDMLLFYQHIATLKVVENEGLYRRSGAPARSMPCGEGKK